MVVVHVDDITVSREHDVCDEFFGQLKQHFPMKNLGELTVCAFERDWNKRKLEMNQTSFTTNLVEQYSISTTPNVPGSPGVDRNSTVSPHPRTF